MGACSVIERAARALFKYEPGPYGDCVDWAIEQDFGWRDRVDEVRLILTAIREPSDAMLDAGRMADINGDGSFAHWQAMIDAMLEEG
jgi:hypothetical protein